MLLTVLASAAVSGFRGVGYGPTVATTGNGELGFDSGEGARETAAASKGSWESTGRMGLYTVTMTAHEGSRKGR